MTLLEAAEDLMARAAGLCNSEMRSQCQSDCCRAMDGSHGRIVVVTLPDLIALAGYLYKPQDYASLQEAVGGLLTEHCTLSPNIGAYMLTGSDGRCPFLDVSGRCTIYTVRPFFCRLFYHCEWIGEALNWEREFDERVVNALLDLAVQLGRNWKGHAGIVWHLPWRYDEITVPDVESGCSKQG